MTKPVCDGMVDRGWGRIINVSSVNGSKGAFGQTNYSAAKARHARLHQGAGAGSGEKRRHREHHLAGLYRHQNGDGDSKEILDSKIIPQIPVGRWANRRKWPA